MVRQGRLQIRTWIWHVPFGCAVENVQVMELVGNDLIGLLPGGEQGGAIPQIRADDPCA